MFRQDRRGHHQVVCARCSTVIEAREDPRRFLRRAGGPPVPVGHQLGLGWTDGWQDPAIHVFGDGAYARFLCRPCEGDGWCFDRQGRLHLPARDAVTVELP